MSFKTFSFRQRTKNLPNVVYGAISGTVKQKMFDALPTPTQTPTTTPTPTQQSLYLFVNDIWSDSTIWDDTKLFSNN